MTPPAKKGPAKKGPAKKGPAKKGPAKKGPAKKGPAKTRRTWVAVVAVSVVLVASAVGAALASRGSGSAQDSAGPGPSTPTPGSVATPTPTPAPTSTPTATPPTGDGSAAPYEPVTAPAVPLDQPADFGTGVSARLVSIKAVEGVAQGPGEVSGPSLQVTVELTNATAASVSLDTTVVDLYAGPDQTPGELLAGSEDTLFSGDVAPGATATAVYVFRVAPELRSVVQVTVSYTPGAPTVLFQGPAPTS